MYASKTPRDLTSHAATICGRCDAEFAEDGIYSADEHAEDSGERYYWGAGCMVSIGKREVYESGIAYFIGQIENMRPYDPSLPRIAFGIEADAEHIDHARRVLVRLANLTKEN